MNMKYEYECIVSKKTLRYRKELKGWTYRKITKEVLLRKTKLCRTENRYFNSF